MAIVQHELGHGVLRKEARHPLMVSLGALGPIADNVVRLVEEYHRRQAAHAPATGKQGCERRMGVAACDTKRDERRCFGQAADKRHVEYGSMQ